MSDWRAANVRLGTRLATALPVGWGTDRVDVKPALSDTKVLSVLKDAASAMTDSVIESWEELTGILLRDPNSSNPRRDSMEGI
jgi:hypothetical protein